jgi:hypothetical protein
MNPYFRLNRLTFKEWISKIYRWFKSTGWIILVMLVVVAILVFVLSRVLAHVSPSILAWIGIGTIVAWTIVYILGSLQLTTQYRSINIEKKEPTKSIYTSSCLILVFGWLGLLLTLVILVLDFKILVLAVLVALEVLFAIDYLITYKKNKAKPEKTPEETEKAVQELEQTPKKKVVFVVSLLVIITTIFRVLPFVVYLLVK